MKLELSTLLAILVWSQAVAAIQQPNDLASTHATAPLVTREGLSISSEVLESVTSMVRDHIANITANIVEDFLKESFPFGMGEFLANRSAKTVNSRQPHYVGFENGDVQSENSELPPSDVHGEGFNHSSESGLLPPTWPFRSLKLLAGGCSPACNCNNNPTTLCCIKVCGRSKALASQSESLASAVDPALGNAQAILSETGTESEKSPNQRAHVPQAGPCNCDNPTTTSCIKMCVDHLKARLDQHLSDASAAATGSKQGQVPLSMGAPLSGTNGSLVALRTAAGGFLSVDAGIDLALYASFVSTDLMGKLNLTAQSHSTSDPGTLTVTINGHNHPVVGIASITVEAFTHTMPAFEDVFYVIDNSHDSEMEAAPELVFGIDHVRQGGGLAVNPSFFT